ncbi:MAG: exodeoxyribonuclease VII large subunit [Acidobacteria bacterium]|nr:exodeoxyribonuclease VII large subunit [Acidobacteriota bacterium]
MTDQVPVGSSGSTFTVSQLCGDVRDLLSEALGQFWVTGEVQRVRPNRNGHLFFELIEKGAADEIVAKLEGVIWRRDYREIQRALADADQEIAEGQQMRCRATLDFYAPFGRAQLVVREIDVVFALGQLAARRQETLVALTKAGLLELNGRLPLLEHPLDLALVTARNSAAYHDFIETLHESGFGFRVTLIDSPMQGRDAERGIASAMTAASGLDVAACVLIRGGGSKTDLAAFDSRRVAEAVARCRVPVLTGLGHQIDESIVDRVAHTALKTPTKVAELLVDRVSRADSKRLLLAQGLAAAVRSRLAVGSERLERARSGVVIAGHRLTTARVRLEELGRFLARRAGRLPQTASERLKRLQRHLGRWVPRLLESARQNLEAVTRNIARAADASVRTARATLDGQGRLARQLGPQRALARGFSITRDDAGRVVRRADQIRYGQRLTTQLADGTIRSRVEEV